MGKNLATIFSAELEGIHAKVIEVEVDLHVGLHSFNIVGLADKALNEAKERVNSALKNSGAKPPNRENRKITVNLAPADIKKAGSQYDLAIALGYLLATEQMKPFNSNEILFIGELALDGRVRRIDGALNIAQMADEKGFRTLFTPKGNAQEASAIKNLEVIPVETLEEVIGILEDRIPKVAVQFVPQKREDSSIPDFSEIKGQETAKRALMIAAAGGHNVLMSGSPGVGKSLLAQAMSGILPDLTLEEAIEITKVWSAAGLAAGKLIEERPFRAPHQTASLISLVGGGSNPKPGEISLAHRGILFLDELPEFPKHALEALRAPMERGVVHIARAKGSLTFPAQFTLVAAMNPCPCGYYNDPEKECKCSAYEVMRYQKKISGPLLDRIDLQLKVARVPLKEMRVASTVKTSPDIKARIEEARKIQQERFSAFGPRRPTTNSEMNTKQTEATLQFAPKAESFLSTIEQSGLSPRGYWRLLKTARTIADLECSPGVSAEHLAEAFGYRVKDDATI